LVEPPVKRTIAFFDGQNLYHAVRSAFGYTYPNFDALALAQAVSAQRNGHLVQTRFYTGVPDATDDAFSAPRLALRRQTGTWACALRRQVAAAQASRRSRVLKQGSGCFT